MSTTCPKSSRHQNMATICFRLAKSGFFVEELCRIGLWPIPYTNTQKSIQDVSSCLLDFENYSVSDVYEKGGYCDAANIDFKHDLVQAIERSMKRSRGLCLNCVKKGRIMIADGNCRATSLELCAGIFNQA